MALLLWYGGLRVLDGTLTVGVLAAFIQYTRRFFQPLQDLSEKFNLLQSAMASSERVFALLDEPVSVREPASPAAAAAAGPRRGSVRGGLVPLHPRRPLGAQGHLVHRVARADGGAGGPYRAPGRPPSSTSCSGSTIPSGAGSRWTAIDIRELADRRSPLRDRVRAAGSLPLHRRHPAQPDPRRADLARGGPGSGRAGRGGPVHRAAAVRLRASAGGAGPQPERGGAAAAELRAGAGARPPDPGAGRGHQLGRRRGRGADPAGHRGADGRAHQPGGGPPAEHHPPRRRDPGDAPRGDPGAGHATGSCWPPAASTSGSTSCSSAVRRCAKLPETSLLACPRGPGYVWQPVQPSESDP